MSDEPSVVSVTLLDGTVVPCRIRLKQPDVWEAIPREPVFAHTVESVRVDLLPAEAVVEVVFADDPEQRRAYY